MPAMTKRVNVRTITAVRTINPPICGTYKGIIMTTSDILKCLCRRAVVEEILPDGSLVRLNMNNYYRDLGGGLDAYNPPKPIATPAPTNPGEELEKALGNVNANVVSSATIYTDTPTAPEEVTPKEEEKPVEALKAEEDKVVDSQPVTKEEEKAPVEPEANANEQKSEEQVVETTSEEEKPADVAVPDTDGAAKSSNKKTKKK